MEQQPDPSPPAPSPAGPVGPGRRILFSLVPLLALYLVVELAATLLYHRGIVEPESFWIYEENASGWTYRFDPVQGYAISSQPSRLATTVSNGVIEAVGTIRGNNLGFPDRDDFQPQRDGSGRRRFAVFGDSFTATQYIERNWPDTAEDLTRAEPAPLELLNFSVDGGGLVNWWSVLRGVVQAKEYELDGIVFAVYGDDLSRGFAMCDDGHTENGRRLVLYGQLSNWQLPRMPRSLEEARPMMAPVERWESVPTARFDALLAGDWHPRPTRPLTPYLARKSFDGLRSLFSPDAPDRQEHEARAPQLQGVLEDIRRFSSETGVPILAIHMPWVHGAMGGTDPVGSPEAVRRFADQLGATFVDGRQAFDGMSRKEIERCWLEYDGHWTQEGSDRFAAFVAGQLKEWPR